MDQVRASAENIALMPKNQARWRRSVPVRKLIQTGHSLTTASGWLLRRAFARSEGKSSPLRKHLLSMERAYWEECKLSAGGSKDHKSNE